MSGILFLKTKKLEKLRSFYFNRIGCDLWQEQSDCLIFRHRNFLFGFCERDDIENVRKQFPDVVILAHPECSPEVVNASDFSGSTKQMIEYVKNIDAPRYLLLTECSMGDNIVAENPHREMLRLCSVRCPHMNLITLEDTLAALEQNRFEITLPDDIINRARASLDRMLEIN